MSLRDDNFTDKHLQKALQHAPDSDVAPSEFAQKAVLAYADKALKTRHKIKPTSWFARAIKAFNDWQLPRWQLAGMGSLAASLLVVVIIWHENPDDLMQVATAPEAASSAETSYEARVEPSPEPKLAQNELAKDEVAENDVNQAAQAITESAPVAASAEMAAPKLQGKAKENVLAKAESAKPETETAPQAAPIQEPADKAVLASVPEAASAQAPEKEADSASAKEAVVMAETVSPAPVAAAPAPQAATASTGVSADAASEQTVARAAPMNKAAKKMDDAAQAQSEAKADLPSAIAGDSAQSEKSRISTKRFGDDPLAKTIVQMGGVAMANQDIQAGKLRILEIADYYKGKPSNCDEPFTAVSEPRLDAQTAYNIEEIYVCVATQQLTKDVALYNQTIREWRFKN